jgi:hypothetical protein
MILESRIPRFLAYLEHVEDRSVFTMPRQDWINFGTYEGSPVQIDVTHTPIGGVAQSASVVAAFAIQLSASVNQIHIYRYDPKDAPTPYNLDTYSVWENLTTHRDYPRILQAASVDDDGNLQSFLSEHVFIVKEQRGNDHWLPALPGSAINHWC